MPFLPLLQAYELLFSQTAAFAWVTNSPLFPNARQNWKTSGCHLRKMIEYPSEPSTFTVQGYLSFQLHVFRNVSDSRNVSNTLDMPSCSLVYTFAYDSVRAAFESVLCCQPLSLQPPLSAVRCCLLLVVEKRQNVALEPNIISRTNKNDWGGFIVASKMSTTAERCSKLIEKASELSPFSWSLPGTDWCSAKCNFVNQIVWLANPVKTRSWWVGHFRCFSRRQCYQNGQCNGELIYCRLLNLVEPKIAARARSRQ